MSSFKLGLTIFWNACWTALPIKMGFALLFMAMGTMHLENKLAVAFLFLLISPVSVFAFFVVTGALGFHFGEGLGLTFLLLISIPIDIWAIGLVSRTAFLERLRIEPPASIGSALWVRFALAGAIYLPLLWLIEGGATDVARSLAHDIVNSDMLKALPVAEKIGLELSIWGTVSTVMLVILCLVGMTILGRLVQSKVNQANALSDSYQGLITRWDMERVPADQSLMLTAFTGVGAVMSILFWAVLPVSTPHPHECCKPAEVKVEPAYDLQKSLTKDEKSFKDSEMKIAALEAKAAEEEKQKDKAPGKEKAAAKDSAPKADAKAQPAPGGKPAGK
ncbi:MAG: hypothetical protein KF814_10735 [Nitrospiraceae bacterium]|nr:hypothetical protein [Nitrospiraceae bacterium]